MPISDERRNELVRLANTTHLRKTEFSPKRPTEWLPDTVPDPSNTISGYFTTERAWEMIVEQLKEGIPVTEVNLRTPRGRKGYVMLVQLTPEGPTIYVKLEIDRGFVWGRSFHLSEYT